MATSTVPSSFTWHFGRSVHDRSGDTFGDLFHAKTVRNLKRLIEEFRAY
jgi:hypothetical protein